MVYEGLLSNTVEGATVELWSADDAAGTNAVRWDAEEYEQDNPLATGADGAYNWNTPTGWYQVRVTKDGYEEARSAWLRVPPIQTEVNIGLVSTAAPRLLRPMPTPIASRLSLRSIWMRATMPWPHCARRAWAT